MMIQLTEEMIENTTLSEKAVISWLNSNEKQIPDYSINQIADASFTSPATVSRAIRKAGYSGIAELKYRVSAKMNYIADEKVVNEIFERTLTECKNTLEAMNVDMILRVIRHIKFAKKIYVIARGTTALIARDFEFQLQMLGYNAYVLSDSQILRISYKLFKQDDLVMIFSVKNSTPELEIAAKYAKGNGCTVVTCCCVSGTSLEKYSDYMVLGGKENHNIIEGYNIVSRLPLHIISRTLVDYLMLEDGI